MLPAFIHLTHVFVEDFPRAQLWGTVGVPGAPKALQPRDPLMTRSVQAQWPPEGLASRPRMPQTPSRGGGAPQGKRVSLLTPWVSPATSLLVTELQPQGWCPCPLMLPRPVTTPLQAQACLPRFSEFNPDHGHGCGLAPQSTWHSPSTPVTGPVCASVPQAPLLDPWLLEARAFVTQPCSWHSPTVGC